MPNQYENERIRLQNELDLLKREIQEVSAEKQVSKLRFNSSFSQILLLVAGGLIAGGMIKTSWLFFGPGIALAFIGAEMHDDIYQVARVKTWETAEHIEVTPMTLPALMRG